MNVVSLTLTWIPSIRSHRLGSHRFDGGEWILASTCYEPSMPGCVRPTYLRAASNVAWISKVTIPARLQKRQQSACAHPNQVIS